MKCKFCNGTGSINNIQCPSCEGFGQISEQTNEEWFTSLSTEEKAKTIICLAVNSMNKKQKGLIENDVNEIIRWLKEKHNEMSNV